MIGQVEEIPQTATAPDVDGERPEIVLRTDEHEVTDDAIAAIAMLSTSLYVRGDGLAHVLKGGQKFKGITRPADAPRILRAAPARIRDELTRCARIMKATKTKDGDWETSPAHPPDWLCRSIEARCAWPGLRELRGVVTAPVLRADGSVLEQEGYDPDTGLLYFPGATFPPVPQMPTREQAIEAIELLRDLVCDVPLADDESFAVFVSGILTPLARYAFNGPAPLHLIDKNIRGAGGSMLVDTIAAIVTGQDAARMSQVDDEDEERKRITSIAMAGDSIVLIDNVTRVFGSAPLDIALTGVTWQERLLGSNDRPPMPLYATWFASGNNIQVREDTARRCVRCRLESKEENPEQRTTFQHPWLPTYAATERPRLLVAALTLLRAWFVAGRPRQPMRGFGSYDGWSDTVRGALVWLGLPDPAMSSAKLADEGSSEAEAVADLVAGWGQLCSDLAPDGMSAAKAIQWLQSDEDDARDMSGHLKRSLKWARLRSGLAELARMPGGKLPSAQRLGVILRATRGRVVAGARLTNRKSNGDNKWLVESIGAGEMGDVGDHFHPVSGRVRVSVENTSPSIGVNESPMAPMPPGTRSEELFGSGEVDEAEVGERAALSDGY